MRSSASLPARASEGRRRGSPPGAGEPSARRLLRALALAISLALGLQAAGAAAQSVATPRGGAVLVVDMDAALRESAAARALREAELTARGELQKRFDAMQAELEAEETEMVRLRQTTPRLEFDKLVVAFDQKVRAARRDAQQSGAALQARFAQAQSALAAVARPLLEEIMRERGAALVIDRKSALAVAPELDVTAALMTRMNARQPGAGGLIPPRSPEEGAP